jgi:hypothetical protein
MRTINRLVLTFCLGLAVFGCNKNKGAYEGPKVDAFHGKVTHNGNPVKFAENEEVQLNVFHNESGRQFGIPLTVDGTFEIGWMPIGTYAMMLERTPQNPGKGPSKTRYNVPDRLTIEEGKKDYVIELGKNFKP